MWCRGYEAVGQLSCEQGAVVERCVPRAPGPADRQCDGVDTDCDGRTDEDYRVVDTACGVGACEATGRRVCRNGRETDTCAPTAPISFVDRCDGVDSDCDGRADENHQVEQTSCGVGACASSGNARCVNGRIVDSCLAGQPSQSDDNCNLVDEDCDGRTDEGFVSTAVTCGVGACVASGQNRCVGGRISSTCRPTSPAGIDSSCNAIDEDCDGRR